MRIVVLIRHSFLNRIICFRLIISISNLISMNTPTSLITKIIPLLPWIISVIQITIKIIRFSALSLTLVSSLITWCFLKDSLAKIINNLWILLSSENKSKNKIGFFFPQYLIISSNKSLSLFSLFYFYLILAFMLYTYFNI